MKLHLHDHEEIARCRCMSEAVRAAMNHANLTQEELAARLDMSDGYMSLMLNRRRNWPDTVLRRVMTETLSAAPLQWQALSFGLTVCGDSA